MEIDKVYSHYRTNKTDQVHLYSNRAAPSDGPVIGYIAGVEPLDNLTNTYKVIVPSMGNLVLDHVPRVQGDAVVGANGVGHKPHALKPGQPVLIRYFGRTRTPIIDGAVWLNGDLQAWKEGKLPGIDTNDPNTQNALFPVPTNPVLLALGGEADAQIAPLIIRSQSPLQPNQSPTQVEVPGSWLIQGANGNKYEFVVGESHKFSSLEIQHTNGPRASLTDVPINQALKRVEQFRYELAASKDRFYALLNGQFIPQDLRRTETFVPGSGLGIGLNSELNKILTPVLARFESVIAFIDKASAIAEQQLSFLEQGILPLAKDVINKWGKFEIDLGLLNLDLSPGLGRILTERVDFTTGVPLVDQILEQEIGKLLGEIKLDESLGQYLDLLGLGAKPTLITGRQPISLQTEGGLITGGLIGTTPPFNPNAPLNKLLSQSFQSVQGALSSEVTSTELDPNIPPDLQTGSVAELDPVISNPRPTRIKGVMPYKLVSSELNNLNFVDYPEHGLASLLTRYGVPNAGATVNALIRLRDEPASLAAFINVLVPIAELPTRLVLLTAQVVFGEDVTTTIETNNVITRTTKPGLNNCPEVPGEVNELIRQSANLINTPILLRDYFFIEPPDFMSWVESLNNLVDYLTQTNSDLAPLANLLRQGKTEEFLVELVYLTTGNDLLLRPSEKDSLISWARRAMQIYSVGY